MKLDILALAVVGLVGFVVLLFLGLQYARRSGQAFGVWLDRQNARTQNAVVGIIVTAMFIIVWVSIVMAAGIAGRLYERSLP